MMPGRAGLSSVASQSRRHTRYRALPCRSHRRSGTEQKTRASTNGGCPFFLNAFCRCSSVRSFLAFRLAAISGLSTVYSLPSFSQVQVPASPNSRPGRLLISIRKKPCGVKTSRSTSLMLPSSAMNSKLDQARYASRDGNCSRTKSKASRSQGNLDSAIVVQLFALAIVAHASKSMPADRRSSEAGSVYFARRLMPALSRVETDSSNSPRICSSSVRRYSR